MRWFAFLLTILLSLHTFDAVAVMSIDVGAEWLKVGIVTPSKPIEIALNKESKRRTPIILGFDTKNNERLFGEDAEVLWKKTPQHCLKYFNILLGKRFDHPMVQWYRKQFPFYNLVEDPVRGTALVQISDHLVFSIEELVAQFLAYAKQIAEMSANQTIDNAVIVVPGYYNQAERVSMLHAATLAKLRVLQLINDYAALATNYAVFSLNSISNSTKYNMYLDFGTSKTMVSIVENKLVGSKFDSYPKVSVKGVGYDHMFTGLEGQLQLRDYLATKFNELKKTKNNVFENARAMAKLFSEAGRLKKILSVNQETVAKVENLLDDNDFSLPIKRQDFEHLLGLNFCDSIRRPIEQALKMSELPDLKYIDQFSIFGGNSRVPKVEECLQNILPKALSKNFDRDEAAVIGAAVRAADLSVGFKVKKVVLKDVILLPIVIEFDKLNNNGNNGAVAVTKKTLYGLMNSLPQKKAITFNRHQNFQFRIYYDNLAHLDKQQVDYLGVIDLAVLSLNNVSDVVNDNGSVPKGVKAHFVIDESGLLNLSRVEYLIEKQVERSRIDISVNLSNTLDDNYNRTISDNLTSPTNEEPITNSTDTYITINETIPIDSSNDFLALNLSTIADQELSVQKLLKLDETDALKKRKDFAQNNLESYVFEVQLNLENNEFVECAEPKTIENIQTELSILKDWLDEFGHDRSITADVFEQKYHDFENLLKPLYQRHYEHVHRPEMLKKLEARLDNATTFLEYLHNFTKEIDSEVFTEKEMENLQKTIDDIGAWKQRMEDRQNSLKKHDNVELTLDAIQLEIQKLDSEIRYLINKQKWWTPKSKEVPPVVESQNETETESKGENESDSNTNKSEGHMEL